MTFYLLEFIRAELFGVGEIKTRMVWRNQGALLLNMVTKNFPQGTVHQVGCRMMDNDILPPALINPGGYLLTRFE